MLRSQVLLSGPHWVGDGVQSRAGAPAEAVERSVGPSSQLHGQSPCIMTLWLEVPYLSPSTSGGLANTWGAGDVDGKTLLASRECQGDALLRFRSGRSPFSTPKHGRA